MPLQCVFEIFFACTSLFLWFILFYYFLFFLRCCEMQHNQEFKSCDNRKTDFPAWGQAKKRCSGKKKKIGREAARRRKSGSGSTNSTSWHVCLLTDSAVCVLVCAAVCVCVADMSSVCLQIQIRCLPYMHICTCGGAHAAYRSRS